MWRKEVLQILAVLATAMTVDAGAVLGKKRPEKENPDSRSFSFDNQSGRKIDVFWVNTFVTPNKFVPQFVEDGVSIGCAYGADKSISSFAGHTFEIRELPSKHTGACIFDECQSTRVTVSKRQEQKVIINRDFSLTMIDDRTKAFNKVDDMFSKCQELASDKNIVDPMKSVDFITTCMAGEMERRVDENKEERSFHNEIHREMASDLIPFACGDVNRTDSNDVVNTTWHFNGNDNERSTRYTVRTLHQLPTSEIFVIDNFVSKDTCDSLKAHRQKTKNGGIRIPSDVAKDATKGTMVRDLFLKMYDLMMTRFETWGELDFFSDTLFEYHKDAVGFTTPSHLCIGPKAVTEAFASIDNGESPKCQIPGGDPVIVDTKKFVVEGDNELANMFLFCDEPKDQLGGIHFPYAGVHITPKMGKLVVAVHRHPSENLDSYVNEHHFCPNHDLYTHVLAMPGADTSATTNTEGEL